MALDLQNGTPLQLQDGTDLLLQSDGAAVGPTITLQPQDESVADGAIASFTGLATGTGTVTYQWYEETAGLLAGETSITLSFTAAGTDMGNRYYFIATDDNGSTQSNDATLTVITVTQNAGAMYIIYPSFFPCPTWEYSQQVGEFTSRNQFDNGWTRQRKRWPQRGRGMNLTFVMGTEMFSRWSTWMNANGNDWFHILIDTTAFVLRATSPFAWSYNTHDTIRVTMTTEVKIDGDA